MSDWHDAESMAARAMDVYTEKGPAFTLSDVADELGVEVRRVSAIVGDRDELLRAMEVYNGDSLLSCLRACVAEPGSTPERLFDFLDCLVEHNDHEVTYPVGPERMEEVRRGGHALLRDLLLQGIADRSVPRCDPDRTASYVLHGMDVFHSWGAPGPTASPGDGAFVRVGHSDFATTLWLRKLRFLCHWHCLKVELGIRQSTDGEAKLASRVVMGLADAHPGRGASPGIPS